MSANKGRAQASGADGREGRRREPFSARRAAFRFPRRSRYAGNGRRRPFLPRIAAGRGRPHLLRQPEVVQDRVEGGDQEQHLEGGRGETEPEARDERLHDLGLEARLRQQGQDPGHGGEGGEQDGPETLPGGPPRRIRRRLSAAPVELDERHQHDGVVHHHPRERGEADHARHGEVEAEDVVAPDHPDEPRRDHRHDQERLDVAPELEAEQQEDGREADEEVALQRCPGDRRLLGLALQRDREPRVSGLEPGHEARARVGKDLGRVGDVRIQIAPNGDRAPPVDPVDAGVPPGGLDGRHRVERHLVAGREGDGELGEVREAVTVSPGQPDVDLVVLGPELYLGRVPTVERGP